MYDQDNGDIYGEESGVKDTNESYGEEDAAIATETDKEGADLGYDLDESDEGEEALAEKSGSTAYD